MAREFAESFYQSRSWQRCRDSFIAYRISIDGGVCQRCGVRPGYIVHHRTYLSPKNIQDPTVALAFDNLEYLCLDCHNLEHGNQTNERTVSFDANGDPIVHEAKRD